MSGPVPTTLLVPPVRTTAVRGPGPSRPAQRRALADSALFDLSSLRLQPTPQRAAALDAEETTPVQPKLEVGPADDVYEQEADALADRVMREPADDMEETDDEAVQPRRKCAACAAEDEVRRQVEVEEEEETVQARRQCAACAAEERVQRRSVAEAESETGPPELEASPQKLTTGGSPLPDATRGFYENRLGRDLAAVRVHTGAPAEALSESINARAFTYGSHVWMGEGGTGPSHTLSHELAHVLQQTQPDDLQRRTEDVAPARAAIQRKSARWMPDWQPGDSRGLGTFHDKVVKAISEVNAAMIAEMPIPNAGRARPVDGVQPTFGFADFWKATTNPEVIPGVRLVPGNAGGIDKVPAGMVELPDEGEGVGEPAGSETAPPATGDDDDETTAAGGGAASGATKSVGVAIANFNKTGADGWGGTFGAKVLKDGKPHKVAQNQHPRVHKNKAQGVHLKDVAKAPANISLGELKPGHNAKLRRRGAVKQLPRYEAALKRLADAVNATNARDAAWTLGSVGRLKDDAALTVPDALKLNRTTTHADFDRPVSLRLKDYKKRTFTSTEKIPGKLVAGRDTAKGNEGVWTYVWMPKDRTLAADLAAGQRTTFRTLAGKLDKLIGELKKAPAKAKRKPKPQAARPTVAKSRPQVRRAPPGPAAAKREDPFEQLKPDWQTQRRQLRTEVLPILEADARSPEGLERGDAIADAFAAIAKDLAGFTAPKLTPSARADLKRLRQMDRMTGPFGEKMGKLRLRFGGIFVKAIERYDAFRAKLDQRAKKERKGPGGFGGWKKVVMTVLVAAVSQAIKLLAEDIARRFATCLDGIGAQLMETFAEEAQAELGEEIAAFEAAIDNFLAELEAFGQQLEAEGEAWLKRIDDLDQIIEDVKAMDKQLTLIEAAARGLILAISCAGAGIGCIAGALGQLAIGHFLSWAADTDRFKRAVINPLVRDLVEPLSEQAYGALMELLLGDPDSGTIRGRLKELADKSGACGLPSKAQMMRSAGFDSQMPAATSEAEKRKLMEGLMRDYVHEHRGRLRGKVKDDLRNPEGDPVTDDQVDGLAEAIENAGLTGQEAKELLDRARGAGGKVDLGKVQEEMRRRSPGGTPGRGSRCGPDDLCIEKVIPAPDDRGTPPTGGIEIFKW